MQLNGFLVLASQRARTILLLAELLFCSSQGSNVFWALAPNSLEFEMMGLADVLW